MNFRARAGRSGSAGVGGGVIGDRVRSVRNDKRSNIPNRVPEIVRSTWIQTCTDSLANVSEYVDDLRRQ